MIKGQKTANELAFAYKAHVSQINEWKKQALTALPEVIGQDQHPEAEEREAKPEGLYQQIAKLRVEASMVGYPGSGRWSFGGVLGPGSKIQIWI